MIKDVAKVLKSFGGRCADDHMGAYAATCAYFLIISFVPFFMIFIALSRQFNADTSALTDAVIAVIPGGLKDYVRTILNEVNRKAYAYVPVSILILLWSAAKVFHALTNGLNVISKVKETRGWFFLRVRSMFYVALLLLCVTGVIILSVYSSRIRAVIAEHYPTVNGIISFVISFQVIFAYLGLIIIFLFIYKFLPNCRYTFRSQLPGALIVTTVWMFVSYLIGLYYKHNANFVSIYGSLTGIILSMIWVYFCLYFVLIGAELNRVLYEDPDDNIFVQSVDVVRDANAKNQEQIQKELDEYSVWRQISEEESGLADEFDIPWENETSDESESSHI